MWQQLVQYPGKGRYYAKTLFGEAVSLSGGVRFFVKAEQIMQLSKFGLNNMIIDRILPFMFGKQMVRSIFVDTARNVGSQEGKSHRGMATFEAAAAVVRI